MRAAAFKTGKIFHYSLKSKYFVFLLALELSGAAGCPNGQSGGPVFRSRGAITQTDNLRMSHALR
jgi:hypothetical protein